MQRTTRWRALVLLALLLLGRSTPARATGGLSAREAEAHVAAAIDAYRRGQHERALAELEVGYAIEPRLEFLISFAQVYEALGRYAEAVDRCERYLAAVPDSPLAPEVERMLSELRTRRDHSEAVRAAASSTARTPLPLAAPATATVTSTTPTTAKAAGAHDAARRRLIWSVVGSVGLVVVGVGLAVGLGLGLGLHDNQADTTLGTVSFR